jgi:N12 class adenine-specific DNA methylase
MEQLSLFYAEPAIESAVAYSPLALAISSVIEPVEIEAPLRAAWPVLEASALDNLGGFAGKFEANMEALAVLRRLQADPNVPTDEERLTLNRYTGWGGLPAAFQNSPWDKPLHARQERLKAALTPAEWEAAAASTPNAHYTSIGVIEELWRVVQRLGFKGGRVLEPSAGVGYFLGAMPKELVERSEVTAVELDTVSSDILKALYEPFGVRIHQGGFETLKIPTGAFDLAISNVPFGNYKVADTRRVPYADFNIHDWFIARMIEAVRPGGLVVAITSAGTMDKKSTDARMHFALEADLLGAVRLPSMAFEKIANTEVTTDVLIFQKRHAPAQEFPAWAGSPAEVKGKSPLRTSDYHWQSLQVNPLFAGDGAEDRLIGKHTLKSNGMQLANACVFEGDEPAMLQALSAALAKVQGCYTPVVAQASRKRVVEEVSAPSGMGVGSFVLTDSGAVAQLVDEGSAEVVEGLAATRIERIKGLIGLRDVALRLTAAQVSADDSTVAALRVELNAVYDAFVSRFGVIHERANSLAFRTDPAWPLLLSLERWDAETRIAEKADIFHVRTVGKPALITHCDTPEEALLVSLAQTGRVDPALIATLTGLAEQDVMAQLEEKGAVFRDPMLRGWVDRGRYLSGNILEKIRFAEFAGEAYASNVDALRAVLPARVGPGEIKARLGAHWIESDDYVGFVKEVLGADVSVRHNSLVALWEIASTSHTSTVLLTQKWGTSRADGLTLMQQAMNGGFPSITDPDPSDPERKRRVPNRKETLLAREKQESIKAAFVEWLWRCPLRSERLVEIYNRTFNSFVPQRFDGSHLKLPGFSGIYTLRKHQLDGIWRVLSSGVNTLLGHVVGAGKTLTAIGACMEARRIGFAKKPLVAVPNNVLEQFAAEWLRAYPSARLLMVTKEDMEKENRRCFLNKVATGAWDAVLMTHSTFERIPLAAEEVKAGIKGIIMKIVQAMSTDGSKSTVKTLERAKKNWEARMEKMAAQTSKDAVLTFDKLGVDMIVLDEAHLFKNLYKITRLRVSGAPTSDSHRAFDMWLKTRHIMAKREDGAGVVFMTATPISNSIGELHTMQSFLQPEMLEALGLDTFDAWAATFGEVVSAMELAPDGSGYRMHERFARFVNVPELLRIFQQVADIKTREMLNLPTPKVRREIEVLPASDGLKRFVQSLVERAEKIRNGEVTPDQDNMLVVTSDGSKAALDLRIVGLEQPPGGKVDQCVTNLLRIYKATDVYRGTQIVFCDLSTPTGGKGWNAYEQIRQKLGEAGVPADEVQFIHDHDSDAAKERLFQAVREGRVRILLGSTPKMGVGTNVQKRLVALHHLDAPWRPSDVEQREGRIDRQGNLNAEVEIYRYVTEGSFDAYMWQTLETKARFINSVVSGDCAVRSVEDVEMAALSYAEVKALASGNPMVIEKALVDTELMKVSVMRSRWLQERSQNQREIADLPRRIRSLEANLVNLRADLATVEKGLASGTIVIETTNGKIDTAKKMAKALELAVEYAKPGQTFTVGKVAGLDLRITRPSLGTRCWFSLRGAAEFEAFDASTAGYVMVQRLQQALSEGVLNQVHQVEHGLTRCKRDLEQLEALKDEPFQHEARFIALSARKVELDEALGIAEGAVEVAEAA